MRLDEILGLLPPFNYQNEEGHPGLWLFGLELLFWVAVVLLTVVLVRFRPQWLEKAEAGLREISRHKRFWLAAFPLGVILLRTALLPLIPIPTPDLHDEFSYLLAGDTFAHGRLTNPPSPMWVHFESFHVNMRPTYQSMYPPGQGMALALGQKLTGIPWMGVLLTTALMCAAIYWMLLGWLPPTWAWLGGAFAWARFGIFSYYMNSYLGGSVAAFGAALVLGALPRIRNELRARNLLVLVAGLLILANSRPVEGFLVSLPIVIAAVIVVLKRGKLNWHATASAVLPAAGLCAIGVAFMLFYNWRGTGNALVMPYYINFREYHISKPFMFQQPNPIPQYRHQVMRAFYVFHEYGDVLRMNYALGYLIGQKIAIYYVFCIWPFLLLIGPGIYAMWRNGMRVVLMSLGLLATDLFLQIWPPFPHYVAPGLAAIFLLLLFSLRHLRNSRSGYAIWASRAVVLVMAVWLFSPIAETLRDPLKIEGPLFRLEREPKHSAWMSPLRLERQRILSDLQARGGKHLVIVRYAPQEIPWQDWIYNEADMDRAKVIWARDMGYFDNQELVNYYPDRRIWYVDREDFLHRLLPYDQVTAPYRTALDGPGLETGTSATPTQALGRAFSRPAGATPPHRVETSAASLR